jgi:hypothetical protein
MIIFANKLRRDDKNGDKSGLKQWDSSRITKSK